MRKLILPVLLACCAGCATIKRATDYHGAKIENGETPIETIEIENTGWLLLKFIPLGGGDPQRPNKAGCYLFRNSFLFCFFRRTGMIRRGGEGFCIFRPCGIFCRVGVRQRQSSGLLCDRFGLLI